MHIGHCRIKTEIVRNTAPWVNPGYFGFISIKDDGTGMDENELSKVFYPFFTTKTKDEGIGLGLSVAYGIMQLHGGFIDYESIKNSGCKFTMFIPASS